MPNSSWGDKGRNARARKRSYWGPRQLAEPQTVGAFVRVGKKIWAKLLAASIVLGVFLTVGGQIKQVADIYRNVSDTVTEWTWSHLLKINAIKLSSATKLASNYHQRPVCVMEALPLDLDRDGRVTDLLIRYVDRRKLASTEETLTCDQLREDLFALGNTLGEFFMFAKHGNWSYRSLKPIRFQGAITVHIVGSLIAATYYETDFPSSTIYGYQGGEMAGLASYNHMIEVGSGDDEETEIFDMTSTGNGVQVRAAEGVFSIQWDNSSNVYKVAPLSWKDLIREGQVVLYVDSSDGQEPTLMINGTRVEIDEHGDARLELHSLDRIVFDPYCLPEKGFKLVPNSLGAVVLDDSEDEHVISCYPSMQHVVVRVVPS